MTEDPNEPFVFPFDIDKAIQAAGIILREAGGEMSAGKLLTLLYLADRESIRQTGHPIIGGPYLAISEEEHRRLCGDD